MKMTSEHIQQQCNAAEAELFNEVMAELDAAQQRVRVLASLALADFGVIEPDADVANQEEDGDETTND